MHQRSEAKNRRKESLPKLFLKQQILDSFKLKEFADDNFKLDFDDRSPKG